MATKKTWKWARRKALLVYRKALAAAEEGGWEKASRLTDGDDCAFCDVLGLLLAVDREDIGWRGAPECRSCPARAICLTSPDVVAYDVCYWEADREKGLTRLRSTIAQLEALDV